MKKFRFSLDSVLTYKQQVLDAVIGEHALVLAELRAQERAVEEAYRRYAEHNARYNEAKFEGLTSVEAMSFETALDAISLDIKREEQKLEEVREKERKKRDEVVEAKKETSTLEKLRENKVAEYNHAVAKADEAFIDELVSMTRTQADQAQQ